MPNQQFVNIPHRDASPIIRGFFYQLETTILRWLQLEESAILELERGEDIDQIYSAINSPDSARLLQQVKLRSQPLTLRSPAILESLVNFLKHSQNNPQLNLRFTFITNARAALERKRHPDQRKPGLEIWNAVANANLSGIALETGLAQLKKLLGSVEQPSNISKEDWGLLLELIRKDDLSFAAFVTRVDWSLRNLDLPDLGMNIEEMLVQKKGIPASQVSIAHEKLLFFALKRVSSPDIKRLSTAELATVLESVEEATINPALIGIIRGLLSSQRQIAKWVEEIKQISSAGTASSNSAPITLTPPAVSLSVPLPVLFGSKRANNVKRCWQALSAAKWVAIRGESGAGKTQLAILLAIQANTPFWIDLRGLTNEQAIQAIDGCVSVATNLPPDRELKSWYSLAAKGFRSGTIIVIDDIPSDGQSPIVKRLLLLATAAQGTPLKLVTTCGIPIQPTPTEYLGTDFIEFQIPPFEDSEIAEYCRNHGAPDTLTSSDNFISFVATITRRHPQMISALVSYMKQRNWSYDAPTIKRLISGDFADDLRLQTQRLLAKTVPEATRELLYRLNVIGPFITETDALEVSSVPPPISAPLERLTDAIGIWIQKLSPARFAVSALVEKLGVANVPTETQRLIHDHKANSILKLKALNQSDALGAIAHLEKAGRAREAAGLLLRALESLQEAKLPAVSDFGLLNVWLSSDIPAEVPSDLQIMVRAQQIRARIQYERPYSGLLNRLTTLLDSYQKESTRAIWAASSLMAITFARIDHRVSINFAIRALTSDSCLELGQSPPGMFMTDLLWLCAPQLSKPEDLLYWLERVEATAGIDREALFGSELAERSVLFICDGFWMREEDKEKRNWDLLAKQLAQISEKAKSMQAQVLRAALVRAQLVIATNHKRDVTQALTIAKESSVDIPASICEFLSAFTLGVGFSDIDELELSTEWLTRAIQSFEMAHKFKIPDHLVRALITRACIKSKLGDTGLEDLRKAVDWARENEGVSDPMLLRAIGEQAIDLWESGKSDLFFEAWQQTIQLTLAAKDDSRQWKELFALNGNNSAYFAAGKQSGDFTMTRPFRGMYLRYSPLLATRYQPDTEWFIGGTMVSLAEEQGRHKEASVWALRAVEMSATSALGDAAKSYLMYAAPEATRGRRYLEAIDFAFESAQSIQNRDYAAWSSWAKSHDRAEMENVLSTRPKITPAINEELLALTIIPIIIDLRLWGTTETAQDAAQAIARKCRDVSSMSTDPALWNTVADRVSLTWGAQNSSEIVAQAAKDAREGRSLASCICYLGAPDFANATQTCLRFLPALEWFQNRFCRSKLHVALLAELLAKFWRTMLLSDPMAFRQPARLQDKLSSLEADQNSLPNSVMKEVVFHLGLTAPDYKNWLEKPS